MDRLRKVLDVVNMAVVAEESGISYNIIINFKKGKKEHLTGTEYTAVVEAIKKLTSL